MFPNTFHRIHFNVCRTRMCFDVLLKVLKRPLPPKSKIIKLFRRFFFLSAWTVSDLPTQIDISYRQSLIGNVVVQRSLRNGNLFCVRCKDMR